MLNKIVLMGRLTRDPDLKHTQNSTAVCSFTLAVERDFDKQSTDFIDCVAWKNTAEFASKYFTKGQLIAIAGRLQVRDWMDKDGGKHKAVEVVCDNVYFAESKSKTSKTDFTQDADNAEDDGELPY